MADKIPVPTHTVTITGYASGGEGIARLDDGRVIFVRNAARGDILEVMLTVKHPRSARAEIVRILTPSMHRIEPGCSAYPDCGGCDFRHITYEEELGAKLLRVNDAVERIGGLTINASAILRTGQTDGYRNKAVFHSDGISTGFYRAQSHSIIPIDRCLLLKEELNNAIKQLSPHGDVTVRAGRNGTTIIGPTKEIDGNANIGTGKNEAAQPLEEELEGLVFKISGFFQVNTGAALLLYQKAREYAALSSSDSLIDLYCGVGSLTLFVGRDAGYALGVELNPDAVKTARENARRNNLSHIEFVAADAANWSARVKSPACVIVDPPRKGLSQGAVRKILELSPKRIVYVSCDPATLARDLRALEGYTVKEICAVDMFPRTANVECCCLLFRKLL